MPEYDEAVKQAAYAELDALTEALVAANQAAKDARSNLHKAIEKHLRARSAPPGELADHTPYDRNHVDRLRRAAGIPKLRGSQAGADDA